MKSITLKQNNIKKSNLYFLDIKTGSNLNGYFYSRVKHLRNQCKFVAKYKGAKHINYNQKKKKKTIENNQLH